MPAGDGTRAGPGAVLLLSLGLLLPTTAPAARLPAAPSSGGLAAAAVAWPFDPVTGEELPWPPKALLAVAEGQNVFFGSTEAAETFKADPKAFFLDGKSAPLADHPQGLPDMQGRSVNCPNGCGEIEVTASRPRIQLKHGQNIYISCFNCLNTILERPDRYFGNITAWQEEDQPRGDCLAEPPLGPTDEAFCPVTGQKLKISAGTVAVQFRGPGGFTGQKIFVASEDAAAALKAHMAEFFLQGADLPLAEYHGGLPEMRNHTVWDPCGAGEVPVDLHTPRIQFRHGQVRGALGPGIDGRTTDPQPPEPVRRRLRVHQRLLGGHGAERDPDGAGVVPRLSPASGRAAPYPRRRRTRWSCWIRSASRCTSSFRARRRCGVCSMMKGILRSTAVHAMYHTTRSASPRSPSTASTFSPISAVPSTPPLPPPPPAASPPGLPSPTEAAAGADDGAAAFVAPWTIASAAGADDWAAGFVVS